MTHLRKITLEELERRNYSETTTRAYLHTIEDFARYFKRPPDQLGPEQIREYVAHLFRDLKLADNTVNQRVGANLASVNGQQQISDISAELAFAQSTMTTAQQSEAQRNVTLTNFLQGIEQADPDKVSAEVLALQTQLQASLQTTAMLYKLSIVNYIS